MSISTAPINIASEDVVQRLLDTLTQIEPFWEGVETERPTQLVRTSDFDQHWKMILDSGGSYVDELGRRVAIRRKIDDDNDANDVHWAAHNAAKLWFTMSGAMPLVGRDKKDTPHSIAWRRQVRAMRSSCREEIRELALQEMTRMRAQADTRTTVVTSPNPYPYPGLLADPSAIRLVVLLPAKEKHSDIFCVLCNSTLSRSESNQYEALSYVWGKSPKRKSITVNGRQFEATENLESGLRNLRYRDRHRVLWIDSMCINQSDVVERNKQVQQMDSIYRNAQSVIVWLGPESDTSSSAFHFLQNGYADNQNHGNHRDAVIASAQAIHQFAKRPWFTRVWCIQEFILGQRVVFQCGQDIAPWEDNIEFFVQRGFPEGFFDTIYGQGRRFGRQLAHALPKLLNLFISKRRAHERFESVLSLLGQFRGWASSDPRDLIFAFYGIVPMEIPDREFLQPDYSLNTSEVYMRFAVQYLQKHLELDILCVATHPVKDFVDICEIHLLPSWVPDWRDSQNFGIEDLYRPIAFSGMGTNTFSFDKMYNAALGLKATSLDFQEDFQILSLDGIEVGTIEHIGPLYKGMNHSYTNAYKILSEWEEIAGLSAEGFYRYTAQSMREAFWRTLLMDDEQHVSYEKGPQRSRIAPINPTLDWLPQFPPSVQDDMTSFGAATSRAGPMNGRRFFKTSRGLIGLAPALAKKGDSIVVLFGGTTPFVLRNFDPWHHLVGECYVHGIMDGEVVHQPRTEEFQDLKVEKFLLA